MLLVSFIFGFGLVTLVAVSSFLRLPHLRKRVQVSDSRPAPAPTDPDSPGLSGALITATSMLLLTAGSLFIAQPRSVPLVRDLRTIPMKIGN